MKADNSVVAAVLMEEVHEDKTALVAAELEKLGIEITSDLDTSQSPCICIRAEKEVYERVFGVSLQLKPQVPRAGTYGRYLKHNDWEQDKDEEIPESIREYVEGVYIQPPAILC